ALNLTLLAIALICLAALVQADRRVRRKAAEALRASEERMRLMLGAVRDYAILELDTQGIVRSANAATRRIFGRDPTGQHIRPLYPAKGVEGGLPARELTTAAGRGRFEDEGPRLRTDGSTFWADVVTTAIRGEDGELRGFAKVVRDVTEQKRLDDA